MAADADPLKAMMLMTLCLSSGAKCQPVNAARISAASGGKHDTAARTPSWLLLDSL